MLDTSNQRPDLMAPVRGHSESGTRILASLEHGGRLPAKLARVTRWHRDGWTAGMTLAVLVLAVLAWMTRQSAPHVENSPALEEVAIQSANPAPEATKPDATSSAATIVSLQESLPAALPGAARAAPDAAAPLAKAAPAKHAASSTTSAAATIAAATRPARSMPAPAPTPTASARSAGASPATPDTDVALLTALVAHTGTPTNVTPERSRDVVLRQEGEGTTLLLARCKQLGLIEGMLCRSRICSGRWESDPACRTPNH